jgi:mono/diheme cytochrome c family protein
MRALLIFPFAIALAGSAAAQNYPQEFEAGRAEYLSACAACHGENADGNGPIAQMLKTRVPGLRTMAADNEGQFPLLETFMIVDGRTGIRGHGNPMPVFGDRYKADVGAARGDYGSEQAVRARVLELVYYLQAIQD